MAEERVILEIDIEEKSSSAGSPGRAQREGTSNPASEAFERLKQAREERARQRAESPKPEGTTVGSDGRTRDSAGRFTSDDPWVFQQAKREGIRGANRGSQIFHASRMAGASTSTAMIAGASFVGLLVAGAAALKLFNEALKLAEESILFSREVALSKVVTQRNELYGAMERAQRGGRDFAGAMYAKSELSEAFKDLKTELFRKFGPDINGIVTMLADIVQLISGALELWNNVDDWINAMVQSVLISMGLDPKTAARIAALIEGPIAAYFEARRQEMDRDAAKLEGELNDFLDPVKFRRARGI